jgi:Transglycosylase SLT domain
MAAFWHQILEPGGGRQAIGSLHEPRSSSPILPAGARRPSARRRSGGTQQLDRNFQAVVFGRGLRQGRNRRLYRSEILSSVQLRTVSVSASARFCKTPSRRIREYRLLPKHLRFGRPSELISRLLLSATLAAIGLGAPASVLADDATTVHQQRSAENHQAAQNEAEQNREPELSAPPAAPDSASAPSTAPRSLCDALATAAAANDLPIDFFARLIWQESRFKADAVSRAGAQGVAQFMPGTARLRRLENPFDPLEAIAKSAQLLRDLHREFGNLGLAAAAYNAGSGRVRDWLAGRRTLPGETRAYVRLVTGRPLEEWAKGQTTPVETSSLKDVPCNQLAATLVHPSREASARTQAIKPWGVEVVGSSTPALALGRYREWRPKYAAIVGDREPHVVIRGSLGDMGAARVRIGVDTQVEANKLCAALRAARTYCDVLRN